MPRPIVEPEQTSRLSRRSRPEQQAVSHPPHIMALRLALLLCSAARAFAACSDAASCNYNGACEASACVCAPQWTGSACATLTVQPASQMAGFHSPHIPGPDVNVSSWGGSILLDEATGVWNMYSAEMINDCGTAIL